MIPEVVYTRHKVSRDTKYKQKPNHKNKMQFFGLRENHMAPCEAHTKWRESHFADALDVHEVIHCIVG